MIRVSCNNKDIPVNKVTFSDGAFTFKVDELPEKPDYIWVVVDPSTPVSIVREEIDMVLDAILSNDDIDFFNTEFKLSLEYTPYARQDRRFEKGNPLPLLNFFCYLRDYCSVFDVIYLNDVHNYSAIPEGLKIIERTQLDCFKHSLHYDTKKDWDVVVAPDKGAVEKSSTIAEYLGVDCVFANKKRDLSTGRLVEMELPDYDFEGKKVLIPDDIADKSGTHMWLSDIIKEKGAKQVDLYVTHAIFPEGLDKLGNHIDTLYVYQTINGYINKEDIMKFNLREEK